MNLGWEQLSRDLMVGAAGSIIGALLLAGLTVGWQWTRKSREKSKATLIQQQNEYQEANGLGRQRVHLKYGLDIAYTFIFGSLFVAADTVLAIFTNGLYFLSVAGAINFILCLSKLIRLRQIVGGSP